MQQQCSSGACFYFLCVLPRVLSTLSRLRLFAILFLAASSDFKEARSEDLDLDLDATATLFLAWLVFAANGLLVWVLISSFSSLVAFLLSRGPNTLYGVACLGPKDAKTLQGLNCCSPGAPKRCRGCMFAPQGPQHVVGVAFF